MISLRPQEQIHELRPRLQALVAIVALVFLGLIGRLCQLQVLEGEHYARRAERNFVDVVGPFACAQPLVASIGPVTSDTARDLGLRVDAEAEQHTIPGLVAAVVDLITSQ